jgi:hypothetical protein
MKLSTLALTISGLLSLACQRPAPLVIAPHRTPPANLRVAEKPLDPRRIKGASGFGTSVVLAAEAGIAGDRVSTLLEVPKDSCAVVIARGSETIEDLDLLAYGEDGTPLGSDEAADRLPSLLICPPHPGRVFLAARIAQGHGLVALGAESVTPQAAARAAERYQVKPRDANDPARLKAWPGLDALVVRERERIGGKFQDLRRVALALDASVPTTLPATIDAGRCVHALFIPSDDVSHLDVAALDDRGRILGRALGSGRQRSLVVCSPLTTEVTFEVRPHAGRGLAVAALSRSVPGSEGEIDAELIRRDVYPSSPLKAELAALKQRLEKLGYRPSKQPAAELSLQVGRRHSTPLELGKGCTRVDVLGGAPLRGIDARLWSESGQLLAEAAGGGQATLFACGPGKARLDTSALLGPGQVAIVRSAEPDAPAELSRTPLAGGRLVARMLARGVLKRADAIGKVTELTLTAQQLTTLPFSVPLERCLDIDVAIEGPGASVELRAIDQSTELELDSAVGQSAASTRLCAYGRAGLGSLDARIELRTTAGTAKAVLATRLLSPAE